MRRLTGDEWAMVSGLSIGLVICAALVWLLIHAATMAGQLVNSLLSR